MAWKSHIQLKMEFLKNMDWSITTISTIKYSIFTNTFDHWMVLMEFFAGVEYEMFHLAAIASLDPHMYFVNLLLHWLSLPMKSQLLNSPNFCILNCAMFRLSVSFYFLSLFETLWTPTKSTSSKIEFPIEIRE